MLLLLVLLLLVDLVRHLFKGTDEEDISINIYYIIYCF
jgi:hypothetical protein